MSTPAPEDVTGASDGRLGLAPDTQRAAAFDPGKNPDWVGLWFKLDELMLGDFIGMRAGTPVASTNEMKWRFLSHLEHDGFSGLIHVLRSEGLTFELPSPASNPRKNPSWLTRLAAMWRLMRKQPRPAAPWRALNTSWRPPPEGCGASTAIAVHSLGADVSRKLVARAKALGVSVNSILLAALNRVSTSELDPGPAAWCMPVNMRGAVTLKRETDNHVSFIDLDIARDATAAEVQRQVKDALENSDHWGNWLLLNIGRVIGFKGMCRVYEHNHAATDGRSSVGTFSNLGAWNGIGDWFVAPGAALGALGVGVIICDGKINLTVEAHPSISVDSEWPRALLDRWVTELETHAAQTSTKE